MQRIWLIGLACLCLVSVGCGDDENEPSDNGSGNPTDTFNEGGTAGTDNIDENGTAGTDSIDEGGTAGADNSSEDGSGIGGDSENNATMNGDEPDPIGAPAAETIALTHRAVIEGLRANLTQHLDEIDTGLNMFETSGMIENVLGLFADDDEEDNGDGDATEEGEEEASLDIDLSDIRDGILDVLTDRLLVESNATVNDDGKTITYAVTAATLCTNGDDDEDESERSAEDIANDLEDFNNCARRLNANPIVIEATSIGERKINLAATIGNNSSDDLKIQIHDDLMAGFVRLQVIKSILSIFVDAEDLDDAGFPATFEGQVAGEAKRLGASHFVLRFAVTEDIAVTSNEEEAIRVNLAATAAPGDLTLNGPENRLEGSLDLSTLRVELPWQMIVDLLHDDEDEVRTECYNNSFDAEQCRRTREDCFATIFERTVTCEAGCSADPSASEAERNSCMAACATSMEMQQDSCFLGLSGDVLRVNQSFAECLRLVSTDECGASDFLCRSNICQERTIDYSQVCQYRNWCEEIREPAPDPPEVSGNLKVFVKALGGHMVYDGTTDALSLNNLTLGDETLAVSVEEDQIIGVDLNANDQRTVSASLSAAGDDDLEIQVMPLLDLQVALTLNHVWQAFVDEAEDLPDELADDVLGIKLDGSDAPTVTIINNGEETEMKMSSGQMTFSSPNMDSDVTIGEGMCMGSIDEDTLTDEEQDAMHGLFGSLTERACTLP